MGTDAYRKLAPAGFFARADWWDAAAGDWHCATLFDDHGLLAAFPYAVRKKWGMTFIEQPPLTPRVSVYFRHPFSIGKRQRILSELLARLPAYDGLSLQFHEDLKDGLPFYWKGMTLLTRYSQVIDDISDPEVLLKNFSKDGRQNLRQTDVGARFSVEPPDAACAENLYRLMRLTFARQGLKPPFSRPWFENVFLSPAARSSFCVVARDENDHPFKIRWFVYDERTLYALLSGQDPAYRSRVVNERMDWLAMEKGRELGLKRLDYLGSMLKGVEAAHRGMGAQSVAYLAVSHTPNRALRLWRAWKG